MTEPTTEPRRDLRALPDLDDPAAADAVRRELDALAATITHREFLAYYEAYNPAELALFGGRDAEAMRLAEAFVEADIDASNANWLAARCAFRVGDRDRAARAVAAHEAANRRGRVQDAYRLALRAGVAAMDGRTGEALAGFSEAFRLFHDLGLAYQQAIAQWDAAVVLAGTPQGQAIAAEAKSQLEAMGARGLAARVGAVAVGPRLSGSESSTQEAAPAPSEVA